MKASTPYWIALGIIVAVLLFCMFGKPKEGWDQITVPSTNTDPVAFCGTKGQVTVVAYKSDTSVQAKPTFQACYSDGTTNVDPTLFTTNAKIIVSAPSNRSVKLWSGSAGSGTKVSSIPNLDPSAQSSRELVLTDVAFRSITVDPMEIVTSVEKALEATPKEPETGKETFSNSFPNCPGQVVVTRAGSQTVYGCYTAGLTNVNKAFTATNRFTNIRVPVGATATLYSGVFGTGNIVANVPVSGKADPFVVEKPNLRFKSIRVTLPGSSSATTATTTTTATTSAPTPAPANPSPPASDLNAAQILAIQNLKPTAALCSETFSRITNQIPVSSKTSFVPSVQTCNINYPVLPTRGSASTFPFY